MWCIYIIVERNLIIKVPIVQCIIMGNGVDEVSYNEVVQF